MQGLTQRQQMVLDYIRQSITDRGYPPTLREIGARMGIRSTNGVNDHLRALERKGYLTREDMKSRALRPTGLHQLPNPPGANANAGTMQTGAHAMGQAANQTHAMHGANGANGNAPGLHGINGGARGMNGLGSFDGSGELTPVATSDDDLVEIRVLGRVAAGLPIYAEEHVIDTVKIDRGLLKGGREVFGLRVQGDSMIDAGILSGDYIFVKKQLTANRGDIVVALIGDEATVKYYYPEKDYVRFQPANKAMAPILVRSMDFRPTMLLGIVVGVFRRF